MDQLSDISNLELAKAIAHSPLMIEANANVGAAITLMSAGQVVCPLTCDLEQGRDYLSSNALSSCILVMDRQQLVGILTERDIVRLSAKNRDFNSLSVAEVMTSPVLTLSLQDMTDIFVPIQFFQKHKVRHLPIIDHQDQVVGLLTHESLQQLLRPIDLLRLRLVQEVMTQHVIHAAPKQSVAEVAHLMATHKVSSVIITRSMDGSWGASLGAEASSGKFQPLGLITEHDIVQFLALGLDVERVQAEMVMSTPVFTISPKVSLWVVRDLMQQRHISRMVVTGIEGELLGIVTQSSLLSVLNPQEIYKMVNTLEHQVSTLKKENQILLVQQNEKLEQELQSRMAELQMQTDYDRLLSTITSQIRNTLNLPDILLTAVSEIRLVLNSDRVLIYRFQNEAQGKIEIESVRSRKISLSGRNVYDSCFLSSQRYQAYQNGQINYINDVYTSESDPCYLNFLIDLQVRANVAIPLTLDQKLWGLLVVQECYKPRQWQAIEIDLLQRIASQLSIALHQATAYELLQIELAERKRAEAELSKLNQELELRVELRTVTLSQNELLLKDANSHLERINQELSKATRLKDEFLASMSHELRTPLNAILGMSEGLQEEIFGPLNERQHRNVTIIERSGRHLLDLINDILDIAKIEAGKLELDIATLSVKSLCESSLIFVKQQAFQKKIQLKLDLSPEIGQIQADERRLRQVLINLLTNAVKFTPESGNVTLSVYLDRDVFSHLSEQIMSENCVVCEQIEQQPYVALVFAIADTGIGIAEDDLPKLFQPFTQIDSSLSRQYTGTGLGLSLVKQIAELHGGFVQVSSQLGQGSCFSVYIPYQPLSSHSSGLAMTPKLDGSTSLDMHTDPALVDSQTPLILLAEDNAENVETLMDYLETYGYQVIWAKNGEEAVDMAVSKEPDLILMDVQMPVMDGLTATQSIRQINPRLAEIPIIMATALAMPNDEERCLQAGATAYLAKPLRLKQLRQMIQKYLCAKPELHFETPAKMLCASSPVST